MNKTSSPSVLKNRAEIVAKVWRNPFYFIAFGFGAGLARIAPGTWGTLIAIPLYCVLARQSVVVYGLVTCFAFVLGVFITDWVSRDLGEHDFGGIVWDEIVGYWLTMFMIPFNITSIVMGFLLFRLFDIWKPQPIRYLDKHVHGGLGIMLDDVVAAVFASIVLHCVLWGIGS